MEFTLIISQIMNLFRLSRARPVIYPEIASSLIIPINGSSRAVQSSEYRVERDVTVLRRE